jgi:hypothetical protein
MSKSKKKQSISELREYVEKYYDEQLKTARINNTKIKFYKSLRGYYKHSILLTDIKRREFGPVDYALWEEILGKVKSSSDVLISGGLHFRVKDYIKVCSSSSFFRSRLKFIQLGLLLPTPFKSYYILNPTYVIKVYVREIEVEVEEKKDKKK